MSGITKIFGRGRGRGGATIIQGEWETAVPADAFRAALEAEGITSLALLQAATSIDLTAHAATLQGVNWDGIQNADAVTYLDITNCGMVGDLALIGACTTLQELHAYGNSPTNGVCADLAGLTSLTYLNVGNGSLGGDIADLSPLTLLQTLNLRLTSVTGDISVYSNFPDLTYTHMSDLSGLVGDVGVFSALPDLTNVYLYNTGIDAATSPSFTTQADLAKLWLHNTSLTEADVDAVLDDCVASLGLTGRVVCELRLTDTAPPSSAGETDQDTLQAAGWTVQVDAAGGGEPTATLDFAVQDPAPSLTTEQQLWWDRVFNAFSTEALNGYPPATGDDMRRHNFMRDPLVHAAIALMATSRVEALEWVDRIGELMWDTLDYGYRHVPAGSVWSDGDHILDGDGVIDSSKLLIFVNQTEQSSSFSDDTTGTNLSYSMATGRWTFFTTLVMEACRQNSSVSLPVSAQRTRTSKETSVAPDGSPGLTAGTETTYGDRFDRWLWYHEHHLLPEWNRYHQLYEPWASGQALDDPLGVGYMKGLDKSSYHGDGGDAMYINYAMWKATGVQKYEDAARELTDFYMDVWCNEKVTDLGRAGLIMPRNFMDHGDVTIGYDGGFCWSGYLRPTDYYREDIARLAIMQPTGWYRFSDDQFLRRVHHNFADNVCYQGDPDGSTWRFGTDVGGHETRRSGWTRPDTSTSITLESCQDGHNENICQTFSPNSPTTGRLDGSPYLACLPWADDQTRLRDIAKACYAQEHGTTMTPDGVGAACALLLDAVVNGL